MAKAERCVHAEASVRRASALAFLKELSPTEEVWILGPSSLALDALARERTCATFGWKRSTLSQLAMRLAEPRLWAEPAETGARAEEQGRVVANRTSLQALVARLISSTSRLGRFAALRSTPGFSVALLDTLLELRLAGAVSSAGDGELFDLLAGYEAELAAERLADPAMVLQLACELLPEQLPPVLLYDVLLDDALTARFARALLERSSRALITSPKGWLFERALDAVCGGASPAEPAGQGPLAGYASAMFEERVAPRSTAALTFFSAPGEARESLEIARKARELAGQGVRFDRMAVVVREPQRYAAHLEEAFSRAQIPLHSLRGTRRPSPSGRAFIALLRGARENLSARRFAEYLSYGQVPAAAAPAPSSLPAGRMVILDEELAWQEPAPPELDALELEEAGAESVEADGCVRAPRAWERMLSESAVLGSHERWRRRLEGRAAELELALTQAEREGQPELSTPLRGELAKLRGLIRFALPLIDALAALPSCGSWQSWLTSLSRLAERALRRPETVLRALSELGPLASLERAEVTLDEVLLVLEPRVTSSNEPSQGAAEGCVLLSTPEGVAGLDFDVVFVAGLAEKMFPAKIAEDPLLLDRAREELGLPLIDNAGRAQRERALLTLAVGAAREQLVLSYPRLDVQAARPRTPSFYLVELWRAHRGALPQSSELSRHAADELDARLGWPAPRDPARALDEVEHDLGVLDALLSLPEEQARGMARYLLGENPHLARSLRSRAERWNKRKWYPSDGFCESSPSGLLAEHQLSARSFSATALQNYAACPYRFYLQAIARLAPRQEPDETFELNPLQRGSLVHEIQFKFLLALRDRGAFPETEPHRQDALLLLEQILTAEAGAKRDELAPPIERVWDDQIAELRADLREWFRRLCAQKDYRPAFYELAFGLPGQGADRDPRSQDEPVALGIGIKLRGSIDLVEASAGGEFRATDYKTGKVRAKDGERIAGGKVLQPVLYAMALEELLTARQERGKVVGGRLSYCTFAGGFEVVDVPLDEEALSGAQQLARAVGAALDKEFLPALPAEGECRYCDYRPVCGPYEEVRTKDKPGAAKLQQLIEKPLPAKAPPQAAVLYELGRLRGHR